MPNNKNNQDQRNNDLKNETTPKTTGQLQNDTIPAKEKNPDDMEILD